MTGFSAGDWPLLPWVRVKAGWYKTTYRGFVVLSHVLLMFAGAAHAGNLSTVYEFTGLLASTLAPPAALWRPGFARSLTARQRWSRRHAPLSPRARSCPKRAVGRAG
jgi:hypothetical protein